MVMRNVWIGFVLYWWVVWVKMLNYLVFIVYFDEWFEWLNLGGNGIILWVCGWVNCFVYMWCNWYIGVVYVCCVL